ncbi:MAG: hypothetical protein R2712_10545 [Vicinamibacterales bacterium]
MAVLKTRRSLIRAVGERRGIQLAGRQHHLPHLAVDVVPVVVDRDEVVVGPDLLDLSEGLEQRLMIPEPHVLQRLLVAGDVVARQLGVARQLALLHGVEPEGVAGGGDVVFDVRRASRACSFGETTNRWMAPA